MFSGRWEKALGVWWNNFGMYVRQILTLRVQSKVFRKLRFFLRKTKFLTISGLWAMVFRFWQKVFGRKSLRENFWQDFLDCNWCSYVNVFRFCFSCFYHFRLLSDVPLDFWRKLYSRFVKTAFVFSSETLVELIDFEKIKHVSKTSDSDRKFSYLWRAFSRSIEWTAF